MMTLLIAAVPFPPPAPFLWGREVGLAMWGLALTLVAGVCWRSLRPVRKLDLLVWLAAAPVGWLFFQLPQTAQRFTRTERWTFEGFIVTTALTGLLITAVRLFEREKGPRLKFASVCLVAFNFIVYMGQPVVSESRLPARRTICKNNLHNLGLAVWKYVDAHHELPPPVSGADSVQRSWRVEMLPWLDEQPLRDKYDESSPWNAPANEQVARTAVPIFQCPSNFNSADSTGRYYTSYSAVTGPDAVFSDAARTEFPKAVSDGTANTLLFVEACGQQIVWTEPRDVDAAKNPVGINIVGETSGESREFASSYHTGGFHATFADGSVRFISERISRDVLKAFTTSSRGEKVPEF